MNSTENRKENYSKFKENWKKQSLYLKLSRIAYYYTLNYLRLNYYYYTDFNKYTSYKSYVWYIQQQDKI